jgi:7-cyano-7-deazaguanine synthase
LMWIDKAQTWKMARDIGGQTLVEIIRSQSHSCYVGDRSRENEWGFGCGACDACKLRADGWQGYNASRSEGGC